MLDKIKRAMNLWRGAALAGALASVVAVTVSINLSRSMTEIQYVAVLSDDKSAPSMLVTFDAAKQTLTLKRVGSYQEAGDKSLQLWALPPAGGPRSLGVLGDGKVIRLTAANGDVKEVPALAISLEPKGGVPGAGGPTGPVLFKGPLIQASL